MHTLVFKNYGFKLGFDKESLLPSNQKVPHSSFYDIRSQSLRLSNDEYLARLKKPYDLEFSAGIWFFGGVGSRFHGPYKREINIEERLEIVSEMTNYGLKAVEAHYPWEINEDNIDLYKQMEKSTGVKVSVVAGIGGDFRQNDAKFGTISSPIPDVRQKYVETTESGLALAKELGSLAVCWPGIDGYTYSLGTLFFEMWDRFEAGLAEAMDNVPCVRVAIEPKPYEPAVNNIYRNTADGILMAKDVEQRLRNPENLRLLEKGHALVTLNPEVGHIRMAFEDVAYAYARVLREARLAHVHLNSQPLGNYDQDLNIGVVAPETMESMLFVLRLYGYTGYFGIDINPEKMPVQIALANCFNAALFANGVINNLDHESVINAYFHPDKKPGDVENLITLARSKGVDTSRFIPKEIIESWQEST